MKRKIIRAPNQGHKILEEQSEKLKEKLESLKQQIQQKKKEKELSRQHQLAESRNLQNSNLSKSKSKAKLDTEPSEFIKFLASLQMDHLAGKLNEKNINTIEQLRSLQLDVIDQWKDIPVGFRIKLKKQLSLDNEKKNLNHSTSPPRRLSISKQKLIEEIVEVRKKDKVFVPLPGQPQVEQEIHNGLQLSENQQQQMINSLMEAFNHEDQIQEIHLSRGKKPTVVIQSKEAWGQRQSFPNYRYCWSCLKKLQQQSIQRYQDRQFCGQGCQQRYKKIIEVEEDARLFKEIEQTENRFSRYLQTRNQKGKIQRQNKRAEVHYQQQAEIDFEIL